VEVIGIGLLLGVVTWPQSDEFIHNISQMAE
jgi:hypothetical protein